MIRKCHRLVLLPALLWLAGVAAGAPPAPQNTPAKALLVISPASFAAPLRSYLAFKKESLPVKWVALEEILKGSPGTDAPEKLKRFLFAEWQNRGAGYVLLVGDIDVMPVRYMVLDRKTAPAFDYAFYPSDLYYADLAKADGSFDDWNAAKEGFHAGYLGEVRGEANKGDPINFDQVDYLPELAVGRWPVSTAAEVARIADKSVACERQVIARSNPDLRRAAFLAVDGWVDARDLLGGLADKLADAWQVEKLFHGSATPPESKRLCAFLNKGAGLVVHAGHGQPDAWEKCFSTADFGQLTNTESVPVFLSAGCSTAHFAPLPPYEAYVDHEGRPHQGTDHGEKFTAPPPPPAPLQTGKFNPTCLGEQLLKRAGSGAVAYIGCNTGSQPCGLTLVEGFLRELAAAGAPRLGDCWNQAIAHYVDKEKLRELKPTESWVPPSIFFQGMKFMVFGDPSLRLPENRAVLPREIELRPSLDQSGVTPRHQGRRGTCSVFTMASAMQHALSRHGKPCGHLSVEYLNWASNETTGRAADGGFFADLWRGFERWGISREEEMPYAQTFDPARKPGAPVITSAKQLTAGRLHLHWIKPWDVRTGLTRDQLAAIRTTLAAGWPVCAGLRWPKHEEWPQGVLRMRPPDEVFDGHSVLLTGYREDPALPAGGSFSFANSNRPDKDCHMTWEYALAYTNDALWITGP